MGGKTAEDAGGEERGGGGVNSIRVAAADFMQGGDRKAGFGKVVVEGGKAKRMDSGLARGGAFERADAIAKFGQKGGCGLGVHVRILFA